MSRIDPYALADEAGASAAVVTLTADDKARLAASGAEFDIVAVEEVTSPKYGDCDLITAQFPGGKAKFFLSNPDANPKLREERPELVALRNALKRHAAKGNVIGPYRLDLIEMANGHTYYDLRPASAPTMLTPSQTELIPMDTAKAANEKASK